jgi:hypothetical protein
MSQIDSLLDFLTDIYLVLFVLLFSFTTVATFGYIVANMKCEIIHHDPVKQEHLEKCAPADDFARCLRHLGYNSEFVCKMP